MPRGLAIGLAVVLAAALVPQGSLAAERKQKIVVGSKKPAASMNDANWEMLVAQVKVSKTARRGKGLKARPSGRAGSAADFNSLRRKVEEGFNRD